MPVVINATHKFQQTRQIMLKIRYRNWQFNAITDKNTIRQQIENTNVPERALIDVVMVQLSVPVTNLVPVKAKARSRTSGTMVQRKELPKNFGSSTNDCTVDHTKICYVPAT